jgi:hypothetical protein
VSCHSPVPGQPAAILRHRETSCPLERITHLSEGCKKFRAQRIFALTRIPEKTGLNQSPADRPHQMIGPDNSLRQQIDAALGEMLADGTIARICARYGIEVRRSD